MRRVLSKSDGVTNVVSMIMIIGIITSMMGMVFATYMPAWGKDIESRTEMDMMNSFYDLKSNLDTLAVGGDTGASLTTSFRLGSEGGPLFGFGRSQGSLVFQRDKGSFLVSDLSGRSYGRGIGNIHYTSNHLYINDGDLKMENGAIIRREVGADILKGPPNIILRKDNNTGEATLFVNLMVLESTETDLAGTQSYIIRASLLSSDISTYPVSGGSPISCNMTTQTPSIWLSIYSNITSAEGLVEGPANDYEIASGTDIAGNSFVDMTLHDIDEIKVRTSVFRLELY